MSDKAYSQVSVMRIYFLKKGEGIFCVHKIFVYLKWFLHDRLRALYSNSMRLADIVKNQLQNNTHIIDKKKGMKFAIQTKLIPF